MNENKFVLPIISLLLLFFLPASIYGVTNHILENRNKIYDHHTDDKLYFYEGKELKGIYTCKEKDCDDAKSEIDDVNFNYGMGDEELLGIFASEYVLVKDGSVINLYNLVTNKTITTFNKIKTYNTKIGNKYIIVQDEKGLSGLLNINSISMQIPMKYQFMGINKRFLNAPDENLLFAVHFDKGYSLIDVNDSRKTDVFEDAIYDYDEGYVYTFDGNYYHIFDYQKRPLLSEMFITKVELVDNYKIVTSSLGSIRIYRNNFDTEFSIFNPDFGVLSYTIKDKIMEITNEANEVVGTFNFETGVITHG